jgi:protein Jumonji
LGLTNTEKLPLPESEKKRKGKKVKKEEIDYECETCRANLFVSVVSNPTDESIFCPAHAIPYIEKKKQVLKNCTLMYTYSEVSKYYCFFFFFFHRHFQHLNKTTAMQFNSS